MVWLQLRNYKIAKLTPTKRRNDHSNIFLSRFRAYVQKIESLAAGRLNYTAKELFGKRVLKSLRKSLKCFWPLQATNENKFCSFVVEIKISLFLLSSWKKFFGAMRLTRLESFSVEFEFAFAFDCRSELELCLMQSLHFICQLGSDRHQSANFIKFWLQVDSTQTYQLCWLTLIICIERLLALVVVALSGVGKIQVQVPTSARHTWCRNLT